jgi:diacylglycerol kinase
MFILLRQIVDVFSHAIRGVCYVIRSQRTAKIHLIATILALSLSLWLKISGVEFLLIVLVIGFVWGAECFNTSIETLVNYISLEKHPLAKIAKDTAAGAVLIAAITSIVIGVFVFLPPLLLKLISLV